MNRPLPPPRRVHWRRWIAMGSLTLLLAPMAFSVTGCFPLAEIDRVTVRGENGSAAGIIVLGVVVDIVLPSVYLNSVESSSSGCDYRPPIVVRATERPFDRTLARFVDENLAWPDSLAVRQEATRGTH